MSNKDNFKSYQYKQKYEKSKEKNLLYSLSEGSVNQFSISSKYEIVTLFRVVQKVS
jgi:hypothetical protein